MDTSAILLAVVATGVGAAVVGLYLMRASGASRGRLERPQRVDRTDAHGRQRIIDRWVYLALELCRVDGAIVEAEIARIERGLVEGVAAVPEEEAARIVHNALRATIRQAQVGAALEEIARHADDDYRRWVVEGLEAIAAADGGMTREEELFMDRVRQELGVARS